MVHSNGDREMYIKDPDGNFLGLYDAPEEPCGCAHPRSLLTDRDRRDRRLAVGARGRL